MFYLLLVILLNTYIFAAFKLFPKYGINALQAISVNYMICVATGMLIHGSDVCTPCMTGEVWFKTAIYMGAYFIFLFNLISYATVKQGMALTTVSNKLSLVIPVVFSYWLYSEPMGAMKIIGILLAVPAVYLATYKDGKLQTGNLLLTLLVFVASGLMDTAIKYIQHTQLPNQAAQAGFTIVTFAVAGALGTLIAIGRIALKKDRFAFKNIIAGILLGIPNYFSIYYLIRLLDSDMLPSSSMIPVNNIGIVLTTTLVAIFLFKEAAGKQRVAGIILAIISIILIALAG